MWSPAGAWQRSLGPSAASSGLPEALRIGVFSEVGHPGSGNPHFSGVSNFLSYKIRYCRQRGVKMDLHSYTDDDRIDEDGSVHLFGWRPRVPVRVDPTIPQDLRHVVPDPRILRASAARCYDVINVVAPGTMGMQGVWVARRLGIPVVAMYTTSLAEYAGKRAAEVMGSLEAVKAPTVTATEAIGVVGDATVLLEAQWDRGRPGAHPPHPGSHRIPAGRAALHPGTRRGYGSLPADRRRSFRRSQRSESGRPVTATPDP